MAKLLYKGPARVHTVHALHVQKNVYKILALIGWLSVGLLAGILISGRH